MKMKNAVIVSTFLFFCSANHALAANDVATPTVYKVTMSKLELCTSSACSDSTILTDKTQTFDIASAAAGADVGNWVEDFALEVGKTYTHIKVTISTTFRIAGYTTNAAIASANCVTMATPVTAAAANSPAEVSGSNSTTNAEMAWVIPNMADADNGAAYGDLTAAFGTAGITRVKDASTFSWVGALANAYTPTESSTPEFTIAFNVANQLKSTHSAADQCYMWVEPPTVTITMSG
jgi:hypothetical protein